MKFSSSVVGLPLLRIESKAIKGYIAPYNTILHYNIQPVFGVRAKDEVFPVDVEPFYDDILNIVDEYRDSLKRMRVMRSMKNNFEHTYAVGTLSVFYNMNPSLYGFLTDYVNFIGVMLNEYGVPVDFMPLVNYTRFIENRVEAKMSLRIGPTVSVFMEPHFKGSVVKLRITPQSTGAIIRGVWELSRVRETEPIMQLLPDVVRMARELVDKHNLSLPDIPTIVL